MKKIILAAALAASFGSSAMAADSHDYCNPVEGTLAATTGVTGGAIGTGVGILGAGLEIITLGNVDTGFEKAPKAGWDTGKDLVNPDCFE